MTVARQHHSLTGHSESLIVWRTVQRQQTDDRVHFVPLSEKSRLSQSTLSLSIRFANALYTCMYIRWFILPSYRICTGVQEAYTRQSRTGELLKLLVDLQTHQVVILVTL